MLISKRFVEQNHVDVFTTVKISPETNFGMMKSSTRWGPTTCTS